MNTFRYLLLAGLMLACTTDADAQRGRKPKKLPGIPQPTEAQARIDGSADRNANSTLGGITFHSVGPTVMSGRVVDVAVNPNRPSEFYVAYASGGLWHTENNGTSFTPLFDREAVMTIGDIAVDWNNGAIYVGTGENNSSRSSYSGVGMYKSTDGGDTWTWMGLPDSHHIGRIVLHPTNPAVMWVAVLGHLYSANENRGVYKTTDGGRSWTKTLYVHENAGAVDLLVNPMDPNELYAATWDRQRRAWDFIEGGTGSGIHKSTDGGESWTLVTGPESGFPQGDGVGRIGLDLFAQGRTRTVFAVLDNQDRRAPEEDEDAPALEKGDFNGMTAAAFAAVNNADLEEFLRDNGFPEDTDSTSAKEAVAAGELTPTAFFDYLYDANANLFDTPVKGAEVYRMNPDGTWSRTHEEPIDDLVYSYGYYFGQIRVHPNDPSRLYIMGVPLVKSEDGGATWSSINRDNVHADHHALWVNPDLDGHLINGNDGGINISYDDGESWIKCNNPAVGQFYTVQVDNAEPYNIYGGLQDNGVWKGPSTYEASESWHQSGRYPYGELMGGDGMQVEVDPRDNATVYTGYQFGNYYRIDTRTDDYHYFQPRHDLGERPLRWNWQTPIELSTHNADILYMGSNKLHRSFDQGTTWETVSDDLTRGGKPGDVSYGTLTSISESTFGFGVLAAGSDDGLVHVSRDGGTTWNQAYNSQAQRWVTRVVWSTHQEGRLYITLNGYRWDDFSARVLVSEDYGQSWNSLAGDLPMEPVNVILEDPVNADILYVGTDHGLYASLNRGADWQRLGNLPATPVHDLVIQPREHDLVVGTHGRSIWVGNVATLAGWMAAGEPEVYLAPIPNIRHREGWGNAWNQWMDPNTPEFSVNGHFGNKQGLTLELHTADSLMVHAEKCPHMGVGFATLDVPVYVPENAAQKLHEHLQEADPERDAPEAADDGNFYLPPGEYRMVLTNQAGEVVAEQPFMLE